MAVTEYAINWSYLNNISIPDYNITNLTAQELMNKVPETANSITNNYYGLIVLTIMLIFLYWVLTDKTQYGYFRFSEIRGLGISLGIVSIFGIVMLNTGLITNIIHVTWFFMCYVICVIYTVLKNPS